MVKKEGNVKKGKTGKKQANEDLGAFIIKVDLKKKEAREKFDEYQENIDTRKLAKAELCIKDIEKIEGKEFPELYIPIADCHFAQAMISLEGGDKTEDILFSASMAKVNYDRGKTDRSSAYVKKSIERTRELIRYELNELDLSPLRLDLSAVDNNIKSNKYYGLFDKLSSATDKLLKLIESGKTIPEDLYDSLMANFEVCMDKKPENKYSGFRARKGLESLRKLEAKLEKDSKEAKKIKAIIEKAEQYCK